MPSRFAGRILAHLSHDNYRPSTPGDIERQMQVSVDDAEIFEKAVALLREDERGEIGTAEKMRLPGHGAGGVSRRVRRGLFGGECRGGVVARRIKAFDRRAARRRGDRVRLCLGAR